MNALLPIEPGSGAVEASQPGICERSPERGSGSISGSGAHEKPRPEAPGSNDGASSPETAGEPGIPGGAALGGPVASHVPSSGVATSVPGAGAPAPGLHLGVTFEEYTRWPAVNASTLTRYLRTARHARHEQVNGRESSAALDLGHAAHAAILELDEFGRRYAPRIRHTGIGSRAANAEHRAALQRRGLTELTPEQLDQVKGMRDAVLGHHTAGPMVRGSLAREVSALWLDPDTGVLCKARFDLLTQAATLASRERLDGAPQTVIADLKTCRDSRPRPFLREVADYGYHVAAAWYLAGLAVIQPGPERGWAWIAVESAAPHDVVCHEASAALISRGWETARRLLDLHLECSRTGEWPGYSADFVLAEPPGWL